LYIVRNSGVVERKSSTTLFSRVARVGGGFYHYRLALVLPRVRLEFSLSFVFGNDECCFNENEHPMNICLLDLSWVRPFVFGGELSIFMLTGYLQINTDNK
jgi:hypothetical protein